MQKVPLLVLPQQNLHTTMQHVLHKDHSEYYPVTLSKDVQPERSLWELMQIKTMPNGFAMGAGWLFDVIVACSVQNATHGSQMPS